LVTVFKMRNVTLVPLQVSRTSGKSKPNGAPHLVALLATQVMLGGVVSTTVIRWLQLARLPHASKASQVRTAVNAPPQPAFVVVLTIRMATTESLHVSVACGTSKLKARPHSAFRSVAQVMVGGVVSATVTVWLQVARLPQASATSQVRAATIVLPQVRLVSVPTKRMTRGLVSQASPLALGVSKLQAAPHSTVLLGAHRNSGGVVSTTLTVWLHVARLPQASAACHVRLTEKVPPHPALVTVPVPVSVTGLHSS
jgi:hypothetical protein